MIYGSFAKMKGLSVSPMRNFSTLPILIAGAAVFIGLMLRPLLQRKPPRKLFTPSPRETLLPRLSEEETFALPYPPDVLPGGRYVETPYGTIKVFEWGPDNGEKVLILPGISTPCLVMSNLAEQLVQDGCRVMLFDFFGRGYSDAPTDVPYDKRLYTSQILLALASSELPWTGKDGFHLMGYSFGGAVAAAFASYHTHMLRSLTLIAPGGLMRSSNASWQRRLLYSEGIFPEWLLQYLVKRRMQPEKAAPLLAEAAAEFGRIDLLEEKDETNHEKSGGIDFNTTVLSSQRPGITVASVMEWQISSHQGSIPAFMSSFRHGPIHDEHDDWSRLGSLLSARREQHSAGDNQLSGFHTGKVLLVLGSYDSVIVGEEIIPDMKAVLGSDGVEVVSLDAGHEIAITKGAEVADIAVKFWNENA